MRAPAGCGVVGERAFGGVLSPGKGGARVVACGGISVVGNWVGGGLEGERGAGAGRCAITLIAASRFGELGVAFREGIGGCWGCG